MDTEDDVLSHKPATLQVEFIRQKLPIIIFISEVQYLPSITSLLLKRIQQNSALEELKSSIHFLYLIQKLNLKIMTYKENIMQVANIHYKRQLNLNSNNISIKKQH
ncbi:unnamed protein product [Rotaria sp. Silwood2]|nr:unnamed protein product [Rotaria sp. Silwood2]